MKSLLFTIFLLLILLVRSPLEAILPLRDQWRSACRELKAGQAREALEKFREFETWYGEEPEVAEPEFREGWIRLWGLAALQAGALEEAAEILERWLTENPDHRKYRAFVRYQLMGVHQHLGNTGQAETQREEFLDRHPELPECALVRWGWADEAVSRGELRTAREQLRLVLDTPGFPESGKSLARVALAQVELAKGAGDEALELLKPSSGKGEEILRFWRALTAPSLVIDLLGEGHPEGALVASGWMDSPRELARQVEAFQQAFADRPQSVSIRQGIWNNHWMSQLERLKWSMEQQVATGTLAETLYPLRLRSLSESGRFLETIHLAQAILESPSATGHLLRIESYKAIIEASLKMKDWKRAEAIAKQFLERYPEDPALPEILFLNARTAAARKDWPGAITQLRNLVDTFQDHPDRKSWQVLHAGCLLESGRAEDALGIYQTLAGESHPSWAAFLLFQQGRCHEALCKWETAAGDYETVAGDSSVPASLREQAFVQLLKLHLSQADPAEFNHKLQAYRNEWPDGIKRGLVENIAGVFIRKTGDIPLAISTFARVVALSAPESEFARKQLSELYRQINDMDGLRSHALDWILCKLREDSKIPEGPFLDLQVYQESAKEPALPESLAASLVETAQERAEFLPAILLFEVFRQHWDHYRKWISAAPVQIDKWAEARAGSARNDENWPAFAAFKLYSAFLLEEAGRRDSADTRRIELLQAVDNQRLGEEADFILSRTAHSYDFPNAIRLLMVFIEGYPLSRLQPSARHFAAERYYRDGDVGRAFALLESIRREWPDSEILDDSLILLSQWHLDAGNPGRAADLLDELLGNPGLAATRTARALLLRAQSDFLLNRPRRGFLDCLRILSLYPDIHDISGPAMALLKKHYASLQESEERETIESALRQSLPEKILIEINRDEA